MAVVVAVANVAWLLLPQSTALHVAVASNNFRSASMCESACVCVCVGVYLITLARAHILFGPLCPHLAWPGLSVCLSVPQAAIVDSTDETKNILAALFLPHFVLSILIICLWLRSFCLPLANCSANYLDQKVRSCHSPLSCATPLNVFVPHALAHCNFFRVVQSFPQRKQVKFPRGNGRQQIGAQCKICFGFVSWLIDGT